MQRKLNAAVPQATIVFFCKLPSTFRHFDKLNATQALCSGASGNSNISRWWLRLSMVVEALETIIR
jgi:hypothetical protein